MTATVFGAFKPYSLGKYLVGFGMWLRSYQVTWLHADAVFDSGWVTSFQSISELIQLSMAM